MKKSIHTDEYKDVINYLITERCRRKLNQTDIAEKLRKTQSFVSKYERFIRRLDVVEFVKICKAIGVDPCKVVRNVEKALMAAEW